MHAKIQFTIPLLVALGAAGCSQKTLQPQPVQAKQQPSEFSFRVAGAAAEAGITFRLTRAYEVGPAANGQVHRSRLGRAELSKLQAAWANYQSSAFSGTFSGQETCQDWPQGSPWKDATATLEVLEAGRTALTARSQEGRLCGSGEPEALRGYAETLLTLTRARYPKSFPSECLALQDEFTALADSARSCTEDSQCTHVDPQFEAIPERQIQYVALKSCSLVPPFPSANREELGSARRQLLKLRESIRATCQAEGVTASCSSADELGFQNHRHPARCMEGSCTSGLE